MRKLVLIFILISSLLVFAIPLYAATPKFRVHILKDLISGFNYSINYPVVIDYDGDGDLDVLIINKEGTLYFLENLSI